MQPMYYFCHIFVVYNDNSYKHCRLAITIAKPFDYAVPETRRRAGQAQHNLVLLGFVAETQPTKN